jgi:hypothetical protein
VLRKAHNFGLMEVHCPFFGPLTSQEIFLKNSQNPFFKNFSMSFDLPKINQIGNANTTCYKGLVKIFSMLCQALQLKVICLSKSMYKWL